MKENITNDLLLSLSVLKESEELVKQKLELKNFVMKLIR